MWGRLFFPVLERRWSGNMRITESMGYKGEKRTKKAGTGSENPYMGSHRPVPAVCLVVAGCSNYSEYRLFSLSENVLSRSFLRWAISSPMVRGGLVLLETTVSITSSMPRVSRSSMRHRKTSGWMAVIEYRLSFSKGKSLRL